MPVCEENDACCVVGDGAILESGGGAADIKAGRIEHMLCLLNVINFCDALVVLIIVE